MKFPTNLVSGFFAGAIGLCLLSNTVAAQVKTPQADNVQQDISQSTDRQLNKIQGNTPKVDSKANLDAEAKSKANLDAEAKAKSKANLDAEAKAKQNGNLNLDADARSRTDADIQGRSDNRADAGVDADIDNDANLGLQFDPNQPDSLTLSAVANDSFAARAGLRQGDRIVSLNGQRFATQAAMYAYLNSHQGQRFPLTFIRDGRRQSVMITPPRIAAYGQDRGWNGPQPMVFGSTFAGDARGLVVNDVHDGSPAALAGLHPGDRIVCFNGWSFQNPAQFTAWMNRFPQGRALPMTYSRDGRLYSTRVTLNGQNTNYSSTAQSTYRDNRGRPVPPPPPAGEIASDTTQGSRRTALRPNFDQMSRDQLEQQVQRLQQENDRLRREMKAQQEAPESQQPETRPDAKPGTNADEAAGNRNSATPPSPSPQRDRTETPLN